MTIDNTNAFRRHILTRNDQPDEENPINLTDRGNGWRFADLMQDEIRYVVDQDKWMVRHEPHWRLDDETRFDVYLYTLAVIDQLRGEALHLDDPQRQAFLNWAMRSESDSARHKMIAASREHPKIRITEDQLDADDDIIATPSGIVDLRTGEFRTAAPDDLCTMTTTVDYDPEATSPHLDQYLERFMPDPQDQEVLFATLGAAIRGGNIIRVMPVFLGETTTGKTQLVTAIQRLLGHYQSSINVSVFRGNLDDKPRPDLVRAMKRRIAFATEASKVWELHADQVKRLTGGDSIPYRNLYAGIEECVPKFTPIIVTNSMPRVRGADPAFRRRMLVISFNQTIDPADEDPRFKETFINDEGCLKALFARMVAGSRSGMMRYGVKWSMMPESYAKVTHDSYSALDHIADFLQFMYDHDLLDREVDVDTPVSHCAKADALYEWYRYWVEKKGDKQDKSELLSLANFGKTLRERGWEVGRSGGTRWLGKKLTQTVSIWQQ